MSATASGQSHNDKYPAQVSMYTESRIEDDKVWYQHLLKDGGFFLDTFNDRVYSMSNVGEYTFDLRACGVTGNAAKNPEIKPGEYNHTDNICELAGAYELGDLVPLPSGELRVVENDAYLNTGDFVLRMDAKDTRGVLREWLGASGEDVTVDLASINSKVDAKSVNFEDVDAEIAAIHRYSEQTTAVDDGYLPPGTKPDSRKFDSEDLDVTTRFVPVQRFSKWTLDDPAIRKWVEMYLDGRVLNACAGKNTLNHDDEVIRNDINPDRDADLHRDAAELAIPLEKNSVDTVLFDPPWTLYQANLRYDGNHVQKGENTDIDTEALPFDIPGGREKTQLGHARLAKENFDYVLKPGGKVIQLTFHGTNMPGRLGYRRVDRTTFDPIGEGKAVIGSVDEKTQTGLGAYT